MIPSPTLLSACQANDRKAQRELYELCFSGLMKVCWRYSKNKSEAVDHYNLGFVHIVQKLDNYDKTQPFEYWAKRVMLNHLIDEFRKKQRLERDTVLFDQEQITRVSDENGADFSDMQSLDSAYIIAAIQELPEKLRIVFNLSAIEGYSHEEIAEQIGTTVGSSRVYLAKAREQLKVKLSSMIQPRTA